MARHRAKHRASDETGCVRTADLIARLDDRQARPRASGHRHAVSGPATGRPGSTSPTGTRPPFALPDLALPHLALPHPALSALGRAPLDPAAGPVVPRSRRTMIAAVSAGALGVTGTIAALPDQAAVGPQPVDVQLATVPAAAALALPAPQAADAAAVPVTGADLAAAVLPAPVPGPVGAPAPADLAGTDADAVLTGPTGSAAAPAEVVPVPTGVDADLQQIGGPGPEQEVASRQAAERRAAGPETADQQDAQQQATGQQAADQEAAERAADAAARTAAERKAAEAKAAEAKAAEAKAAEEKAAGEEVAPAGGSVGAEALAFAKAAIGKPYRYGAAGPNAFDCSGLVMSAFKKAGATLPRTSAAQSRVGTPVSRDQLQPGDLVFFYSPVSHVGIYLGGGKMVHASTSGEPVKISDLGRRPFHNARRI